MRPDSRLFIVPAAGGVAREMRCNTRLMNSWHSFSPNGRWLVFSSKSWSPYTRMFLTHLDKDGRDSHAAETLFEKLSGFRSSKETVRKWQWTGTFSAMLRFLLRSREENIFSVQRWCFRGSVDGWTWDLDEGRLAALVKKNPSKLVRIGFINGLPGFVTLEADGERLQRICARQLCRALQPAPQLSGP
jgi:hypothetical protein